MNNDPSSPDQTASGKKRILYVEDNPANIRLVAKIISRIPDVELECAHTGAFGLDLAFSLPFDLIILDINLPGLSGFEILQGLRLNQTTGHIPVIALSASAMPKEIERGLAAGFDHYLTKPLQVEEFSRVIQQMLKPDTLQTPA